MKKTSSLLFLLLIFAFCQHAKAAYSGSFTVNGDLEKFYPVLFEDKSWYNNRATSLEIGRSNVHLNASWRGSIIANFKYHVTNWGNGSSFIDANIRQISPNSGPMIAGWIDPTSGNNNINCIIIWLKGGGTTYNYTTDESLFVAVYDNVSNNLPFQELNGPAHTFKTAPDVYVNSLGYNSTGSAYYAGGSSNYFGGNVGIGSTDTHGYKLAVNGNIRAKEIKVEADPWPDYVFAPTYALTPLTELKTYIDRHQHLPGIPSAIEVAKEGINLGEMNLKLLQKVEELTLYLIEKDKTDYKVLKASIKQNNRIRSLENEVKRLRKK
jgi:hypothetical protein